MKEQEAKWTKFLFAGEWWASYVQGLAAGCEVFMWAQINGYETVQERRYKICITAISV